MLKTFADFGIEVPHGRAGELDVRCPKCSHERKKKQARCLSVNADKGTWLCHHCGFSGGLAEGEKRLETAWRKPTFRRPSPPAPKPLDPVAEYLGSRGISRQVIDRNRVTAASVYMPQVEDHVGVIAFPYYRGDELVNVKYRDREKNFRMEAGAERILYGLNDIESERCVIVEGECFPGDAEVLTRNGWCRLDCYCGQEVLQVGEREGEFVRPLAVVRKAFSGNLVRHEVKGWVSVTTPDHNLVSVSWRGSRWRKFRAADGPSSRADLIPRTTLVNGPGIALTEAQLRLCIAVSADASIREENYRTRYAVFGLKKSRKVVRLLGLLRECGILASATKIANGYDSICFHMPDWIPGRMLPWEWIADATMDQRELLIAELAQWDGNSVPNRDQTEYSSKHEQNAAWVQALCHTAKRCSSIIDRSNEHGRWFKVSMLHGKSASSWQSVRSSDVPYDGDVYCLTVPSGMLLVRQERKITVSGNCDKLSVEMTGITSCVSVPDGAPTPTAKDYASKFSFLEADAERLQAVKRWVIAVDADEPGQRLEDELGRRLGREKCVRVRWPNDCKDANDVLRSFGPEVLRECIDNAEPFPIEGIFTLEDASAKVSRLFVHGWEKALSTGWDELDQFYTVRPGEMTVVTGIPGSGKSNVVDALIANLARDEGWRFMLFSPENQPVEDHVARMLEKHSGQPFFDGPSPRMDQQTMQASLGWAMEHFFWYLPGDEDQWTLANVLSAARQLVYTKGIRGLVIDPWNELESARPRDQTETEYIGTSLRSIRQFARRHSVHVWVVAHPQKLQREDGKYPVPTLYDCSGSAHWRNKADNGLCVWRDFTSENAPVELHVQKIRFRQNGKIGVAKFEYRRATATYHELPYFDRRIS